MVRHQDTSGSDGGISMTDSTDALPALADVYRALGAPRRCHAIHLLSEFDDTPIQASTLADHITVIEEEIPPSRASGAPYRNVYNALCQTHLPTLADVKVIRYDSSRKTLTIGPRYPVVRLLLGLNCTAYTVLEATSDQSMPAIGD